MPPNLKVGDVVECVKGYDDSTIKLIEGHTYTLTEHYAQHNTFKTSATRDTWWSAGSFKLAKPAVKLAKRWGVMLLSKQGNPERFCVMLNEEEYFLLVADDGDVGAGFHTASRAVAEEKLAYYQRENPGLQYRLVAMAWDATADAVADGVGHD